LQVLADKQQNRANMYAINILRLADSLQYEEPIILPGEGELLLSMGGVDKYKHNIDLPYNNSNITKENKMFTASLFNVYPNPVSNDLFIEYNIADNASNVVVDITKITAENYATSSTISALIFIRSFLSMV